MMSILKIVLIIVVLYLFKFLFDVLRQNRALKVQGGVKIKYKFLIDAILSGDKKAKIIQENDSFVAIALTGMSGYTVFKLYQTFGNITIVYELNSVVFGRHKLEWTFSEKMDQQLIVEKMMIDIEKHYNKINVS